MSPREISRNESELWKDKIDRRSIEVMARELSRVFKNFDQEKFISNLVNEHFLGLELKERIQTVAESMHDFLPKKYSKAVAILVKAAPRVKMFENWILTTYVELYGLDDFDTSIAALEELTKYGTGEFAIRPFIIRHTDRTMKIFHQWAEHPNEHIRRLAAEGSRPRGVWVAHIVCFKKNPAPVLKLLEKMKADQSLYVRKAVANNLNDISRDNPDAFIRTVRKWKKDKNILTDWIIKHGCRSLLKAGNPDVLSILGFTASPKIKFRNLKLVSEQLAVGDQLEASFEILSQVKKSQKLAIDYRIYFRNKSGGQNSKLFKFVEKTVESGQVVKCLLRHKLKKLSTRNLYSGSHRLEVIINGNVTGRKDFSLTI